MKFLSLFLIGLYPGIFCAAGNPDPVTWWQNGEALPTIVLPVSPSPTESYAATELRSALETMGIGPVDVVYESTPSPEGKQILIGHTSASDFLKPHTTHSLRTISTETSVVHPDPERNRLYLLGGGDRGTLYAVYDFLEMQGCRWFEPGPEGEHYPRRTTLIAPAETRVHQPTFAVREIGRSVKDPADAEELIAWCARNRLNRLFSLRTHPAWSKRGGQVQWQHICHNTPWMVPNERYFDSHPEYFALYHGNRLPQGMEGGYLCTINPEVQDIVARFVLDWFERNPEGEMVPISPPDGAVKWCECADCAALGGKNFEPGEAGHMTRRQVEFINAVADRVAAENPDARILHLAYSDTVWPYEGISLRDNVVVQVAHGYAGNGSLVHSIQTDWNTEAREVFETWAEAGSAGIGIWDYFILRVPDRSGSALTPLGFGRVAFDMVDYLAAFPNPYKVYFTQAGNDLHASNAFLYYALARKLHDPAISLENVRNSYSRHRFGDEAGVHVAAYLKALDQAYTDSDWNPEIWRDITVPSPRVFTQEVLATLRRNLEAADIALESAPPAADKALERLWTSLQYVETAVRPKWLVASESGDWEIERGGTSYVLNSGPRWKGREAWERLKASAVENDILDEAMMRVLFRTLQREESLVWLENDRIQVGILPGIGGRILRLIDKQHGENLLYEPEGITSLSDPGASYFRYGGYEEYTRKAFASPGWEMHMDHEVRETPGGTRITLRGTTRENILLERILEVQAGDLPELRIHTRITNKGDTPFPSLLRVHPEFQLTPRFSGTRLILGRKDGTALAPPLAQADLATTPPDGGYWGLVRRDRPIGFVHDFDPEVLTGHLHLDHGSQTTNLELFAEPRTLAPGESTTVSHRYRLFSGPEEAPEAVQPLLSEKVTIPPQTRDLSFVKGAKGNGIRLGSTATPTVETGVEQLSASGTFLTWVSLDSTPSQETDALLFTAGNRQPDYMVLAIREGKLVFYRTQRTADTEVDYRAWVKVEAPLPDWEPNTWHQLGVTWENDGEGKSRVRLIADGKEIAGRADLDMVPFQQVLNAGVGWDTSNASRPRLQGVLDETVLTSAIASPQEILRHFRSIREKASLSPLFPNALLESSFEQRQFP